MKTSRLGVFFACGLIAAIAHAEIYTWVDANGVRHYSDTPAGRAAHRADLPGVRQAPSKPKNAGPSAFGAERGQGGAPDSPALELVAPKAGATLRSARGIVPIAVSVGDTPTLRAGEKIIYYLDGRPIAQSPTQRTRLQLSNVTAGTHTLAAGLAYQGRELRHSQTITFAMQRRTPASSPGGAGANAGGDTTGGAGTAPPGDNIPSAPGVRSPGSDRPPS